MRISAIAQSKNQRIILARAITFISQSTTLLRLAFSAAIHIWTVSIAFHQDGVFAAIITSLFPGIAEIYWFFIKRMETGTFINKPVA